MQALAVEVTEDGQIIVPADERQRLNLKSGEKIFLLMATVDDERMKELREGEQE